MSRQLSNFLIVHWVAFLLPGPALAFCLVPNPPRVCTEFFKASAVFIGTVTSVVEKKGEDDFIDGWVYKLNVKKNYRGLNKSSVEVFTANDSGRFPLEKDRTYLLFPVEHGGALEIYGCGNSAELPKASAAIGQIEDVLRNQSQGSGGDIGGQIDRLAGINVVAKGKEASYQTSTDSQGSFHLHVPAGHYSVEAKSPDWAVSPVDISYERPDNVEIHNGGCADLASHAVPLNVRH